MIVDGDDLHLQVVPDLADVLHPVDVFVVELADVAQAVASRQNFDECAKVFDGGHPPVVDLADADFLGQGFDLELGSFGAGRIHVRDKDRAVIVDIDLGARGLLNAFDGLAAGANKQTDFLRMNADRDQARGVLAWTAARLTERG